VPGSAQPGNDSQHLPGRREQAAMSASLIRPGGYGQARVLDDVGHLALHRALGLRCLTWSRPSGLAGGWI